MTRRSLLALHAAALLLVTAPQLHAQAAVSTQDDRAAVRAALEHYINGHAKSSQDEMRLAFHPNAYMTAIRDGRLVVTPIGEYIARINGTPAKDEAQRRRRIVNIEVDGTIARARIELDHVTTRFVDFMTLAKTENGWRIVAKSYHAAPVAKP